MRSPDIQVELTGQDGNAFAIIGRVVKELQRNKVSPAEIADYKNEAMSGDYNHLLTTTMEWVEVL